MDQVSRLVFDIVGRNTSGTKALNDAAVASDRAHQGFSKLGSTLSGLGGPFEAVVNYAGQLGDSLEKSLAGAQKVGLALTATGVGLTAIAASEQQAQSQLRQAIDNTGASYGDYSRQIEEAIKQQENYAHSATDTQNALNTLTIAFQDPERALKSLADVANLAAIKHESLAEAATSYIKATQGQTRSLLSLGIHLDGVGSKTDQINRAMAEFHQRVAGQASAAVDTFGGRLKVMETRLHDNLAALGKYGPEITAAGAALTVYASVLQLKAARQVADTIATERETQAELANAAARARTAEAAGVEAAAISRATLAQGEGALAGEAGALGGVRGLAGGLTKGLLRGLVIATVADLVGNTVGGGAGHAISNVGKGAAVGSLFGPEGAIAGGAIVGAGIGVNSGLNALQSGLTPSDAESKVIQQLMAGGKGEANLAKLHQIAANQMKNTGHISTEVTTEINGLTAALNRQKTAITGVTGATQNDTTALIANADALLKSQANALSMSQQQDQLRQAIHNMAVVAGGQSSKALKGNSDAALANRDALRGAVQQAESYIQTLKQHGASATTVANVELNLARAIKHSADETYGDSSALNSLLKQLGFMPSQIAAVTDALNQMSQAWNPITGSEHAGLGDFAHGTNEKAKHAGGHLAQSVVAGYTPVVASGVQAATKSAISQAELAAKQLEQSTVQAVSQAYQNVKQQVTNSFNLTSLPQKTDLFGTAYGPSNLAKAANAYVRQLEEWARLLGELRKAGLNERAIEQFEAAGVAAIPAMRQLLQHRREIRTINKDFRIEDRIGGQVAAAQVEATRGAQLERDLARWPKRTADELAKVLKHLNIQVEVVDISKAQAHHVRRR